MTHSSPHQDRRERQDIALPDPRLATVMHELRTPLGGILALAEQLLENAENEGQRQQLRALKAAADQLRVVASEVLDAAKMAQGALTLQEAPFAPRQMMDALATALDARARTAGLALRVVTTPSVPAWLCGDAVRLRQMIENLADNALKLTRAGSVEIELSAEAQTAERYLVTASVRDTGPGIDPARAQSLFEPFVQGAHHAGGTGLGLAIVRDLARAMGGGAKAAPRAGGGAEFSFSVPLPLAPEPRLEGEKPRPRPSSSQGLNVLVAEDNAINRVVVGTILDQFGHRHTMVQDGRAAVQAIAAGAYDLVLMDAAMPDMDGLSATAAIRALAGPQRSVPVIGVTARAYPAEIAAFRDAGADAVVTKPISVRTLWSTIEEVVGPARLAQA